MKKVKIAFLNLFILDCNENLNNTFWTLILDIYVLNILLKSVDVETSDRCWKM